MTATIRQKAQMRVHSFRRRVARESLIDSAVNVANLETARSFELEPVDLGWPLWAHVAFWLAVVSMWGIAAYLYWHQMLPPWFVEAMR